MMNQTSLDQIWAQAAQKPYKGKSLADWLATWTQMSTKDLEKANSQFLKIMTTWVFRKFNDRGKNGVPMGYLGKFVLPENQQIHLFETLAAHVVSILRKRGLREIDVQPNVQFNKLVEAWDRANQNQR